MRNTVIVDSLLFYETLNMRYKKGSDIIEEERRSLYPFIAAIFDANVFQTMVASDNDVYPPAGMHTPNATDKKFQSTSLYIIYTS